MLKFKHRNNSILHDFLMHYLPRTFWEKLLYKKYIHIYIMARHSDPPLRPLAGRTTTGFLAEILKLNCSCLGGHNVPLRKILHPPRPEHPPVRGGEMSKRLGGIASCNPIYSGHTTSRGHTGFLHLPSAVFALIFIARRIQPSLSLVDRDVDFCVTHELIVLH